MSTPTPDFDGATYSREKDHARLSTLLERVRTYMEDGQWHSLADIQAHCGGFGVHAHCGGSEASCSARLRDLRKDKFGGYNIIRARVGGGLWMYRMVKP